MVWGLIPHFAADEKYKYKTINAKAETVDTLPTFRHSLSKNVVLSLLPDSTNQIRLIL